VRKVDRDRLERILAYTFLSGVPGDLKEDNDRLAYAYAIGAIRSNVEWILQDAGCCLSCLALERGETGPSHDGSSRC
jgi:hypothetical protein